MAKSVEVYFRKKGDEGGDLETFRKSEDYPLSVRFEGGFVVIDEGELTTAFPSDIIERVEFTR